jgi:hypothetical protein
MAAKPNLVRRALNVARSVLYLSQIGRGWLGTTLARRGSHPNGGLAMQREQKDNDKDKVEGEGSYSGTKEYNQRTKKFVESGKVDEAAHDAEPKSEEEKHAMQKAERIGRQKARK